MQKFANLFSSSQNDPSYYRSCYFCPSYFLVSLLLSINLIELCCTLGLKHLLLTEGSHVVCHLYLHPLSTWINTVGRGKLLLTCISVLAGDVVNRLFPPLRSSVSEKRLYEIQNQWRLGLEITPAFKNTTYCGRVLVLGVSETWNIILKMHFFHIKKKCTKFTYAVRRPSNTGQHLLVTSVDSDSLCFWSLVFISVQLPFNLCWSQLELQLWIML